MSILKSSVIVSVWTLFSRVLGFLRDVAIANKLGASLWSDAFFIALTLPNLLRRLLAEGAFNVAFVPVFSEHHQNDSEEAQAFTNAVFTWLCVVLLIITVVAEIFMPWLVLAIASGFADDAEKFNLTVSLARVTFPYLMLITLASLMGALCNSLNRFAAYAFVPAFLNISLIGCLFLIPEEMMSPVYAAAWAVPLGGIFQLGFMAWAFRQTPLKLRFVWPPVHPSIKELLNRFAPAALGVGVLQISFLVDTILASHLQGNAVSILQFANRFYQLPLALIGTALATVLLPHFSRALSKNDHASANRAFTTSLTGGISLALASTVGLGILAEQLMATLLQHGEFTAQAAYATAMAMVAYSLGLPGYILTKITSTAFFAAGDTKTPLKASGLSLILNIICNLTLMYFYGYIGIALATSISGYFNASLQLYWLHKKGIFHVSFAQWVPVLKKALPLSILMGFTLLGYKWALPYSDEFLWRFIWLAAAVGLGTLVFMGGAVATGLVEIPQQVLQKFNRKR